MNGITRIVRLYVETLEARDVPAGNLPWPIAGAPAIWSTYGQFIEGGGLHLHEAVDIVGTAGVTPVRAIENGSVFNASVPTGGSDDYISAITADHGWNYYHATQVGGLAPNSALVAGTPIATVANSPDPLQYPAHLHLDYTSNTADTLFP